jgi:hypothetical protein
MTTVSDETQVTIANEEVEPPCKKLRLQDQTHFTHLKLHTRLIIYDFVDIEFMECTGLLNFLWLDYVVEVLTGYEMYSDLLESSRSYSRMTVVASILGDLHTLQYLAGIPDNIFIPRNHEDLLDHESFNLEDICYLLARNGHWKALKWAMSEQYPHYNYTLRGAVQGGAGIEMLQWLHSQGCWGDGDEHTLRWAAVRGDWNIMKWLREIGCPWDLYTFSAAVRNENFDLEVLKWLKSNNCPWGPSNSTFGAFVSFTAAIDRGDLKILLWLRMEGCPWDSSVLNYAIREGIDLFTLQWFLYEDISLMNHDTFNMAIQRGDIEILEWLRSKNCPVTFNNFVYAIEHKVPMNILEWMHHAQFPLNEFAFVEAVQRGDWDILDWFRQKSCPWNASCYKIALANKRFDNVKWLHSVLMI